MARRWTDPRDGNAWLVDALPFELPASGNDPSRTGWTLLFASHSLHWLLPVGYELGIRVPHLPDQDLIALLDAARTRD